MEELPIEPASSHASTIKIVDDKNNNSENDNYHNNKNDEIKKNAIPEWMRAIPFLKALDRVNTLPYSFPPFSCFPFEYESEVPSHI